MSTMNKSSIVNLLKEGTVEIKFTKTDGSLRTMKATLAKEGIEIPAEPTGASSLSVYDTDLNEYRAFRWDALKSVNGETVSFS